jgi:hypothetical protein
MATRCSCIDCSRADCVRGLARLISSAISNWQNTGHEAKRAAAVDFVQHLAADDVGRHQVWGELHALGIEAEDHAHGLDEAAFAQAGDADQQSVAAGEDGGEGLLDHRVLTKNDAADFGPGFAHEDAEGVQLLDHARGLTGGKVRGETSWRAAGRAVCGRSGHTCRHLV